MLTWAKASSRCLDLCQDPLAAHTDTQTRRITLQLDTLLVSLEDELEHYQVSLMYNPT